MKNSFWNKLKKPIIGLAPMDGVTDAPFRYITAKYGKPDVTFTEFTSVEGICAGALKPLNAFYYDDIEKPIVAQLFGNTPECFYKASFLIFELGFDGLDINMGCPSKNVASKGSGASLIGKPELAKKIIRKCKQASEDWINGKTIEESELPEEIIKFAKKHRHQTNKPDLNRKPIPISVKTRIGISKNIAEEWIKHLLEESPAAITVHGRTLKQMYSGESNWEAIAKAAEIIKQTETLVLGNGDIDSVKKSLNYANKYSVDGVLIGRAVFGKPWIFNQDANPSINDIFKIAVEHSKLHESLLTNIPFLHMRKHLAWYCKGFHGASSIRQQLMKAENAAQVEKILASVAVDIKMDS